MYVWFSQLGFPHSTLEFPYKRQSPLTKKNKEYESIEDVTDELYALVETFADSKFTLGRNLYFHIPSLILFHILLYSLNFSIQSLGRLFLSNNHVIAFS